MTTQTQTNIPENILAFVKSNATFSNYFVRVWKDKKCFALPFDTKKKTNLQEAYKELARQISHYSK